MRGFVYVCARARSCTLNLCTAQYAATFKDGKGHHLLICCGCHERNLFRTSLHRRIMRAQRYCSVGLLHSVEPCSIMYIKIQTFIVSLSLSTNCTTTRVHTLCTTTSKLRKHHFLQDFRLRSCYYIWQQARSTLQRGLG